MLFTHLLMVAHPIYDWVLGLAFEAGVGKWNGRVKILPRTLGHWLLSMVALGAHGVGETPFAAAREFLLSP